jgi:pentatricopeptide repeat protein
MLGSYVCRQCRTRLSRRIVPFRSPQWQPRATFLSLRNSQPQNEAEPTPPEEQPLDQRTEAHNEGGNQFKIRYSDPTEHAQQPPRQAPGRYSRHVEDDAQRRPLRSSRPQDEYSDGDRESPVTESTVRGQGPAVTIDNFLRNDKVDQAWAVFEGQYTSRQCEALMEPVPGDVPLLNEGYIFEHLLRKVSSTLCRGFNPKVTPTEVLFRYEQLGLAAPELWTKQAISFFTHQAIQAASTSHNNSTKDLSVILPELVSLWRLFFQFKGAKPMQTESISTDWNLPAIKDLSQARFAEKSFIVRLAAYHPRYVGNSTMGFCAAYFYTLSDSLKSVKSLHKEAEPLLHVLGFLLPGSNIDSLLNHTRNSTRFLALPENVQTRVAQTVRAAPENALRQLGAQGLTLGDARTGDPATDLENFNLKRITRAASLIKSPVEVEKLWKEMIRAYTTAGKVTIPERIYNAFLHGFMIHHLPQRSVDVWNHMVANDVKPSMQSWVALLSGCVKSNNFVGFNEMWTRMLATGVEPDNYAWTTRVNGLMSFRQTDLSLAALDDMGKRWLAAEAATKQPQPRNPKGSQKLPSSVKAINKCTKPTVGEVNGAITAIAQINDRAMPHAQRVENIQKILRWSGNFDIKPDAVTFNSMIRLYVRAKDYVTAFKVLRQMEKSGIAADLATHNMLLSVTFDNHSFDRLSHEEQSERIIGLFRELEADGLEPNMHIYSTATNRLLKDHANHDAVRKVIDFMRERGKAPGVYIYVSLVTHYFQQSPPDIESVDSLTEELFKRGSGMATDAVLFDRLIEGYATHNEIGKMMSVLTRMSKHNRSPSWTALVAVVEALAQNRDYERIRDIGRDVTSGTNIAKGKITGGNIGEWKFFKMIENLGINLQEDRMGDYMVDGQAMGNSGKAAFLSDPFSEQPKDALTKHERTSSGDQQNFGNAPFEQEPGSVQYEQEPGSVQYEQQPGSVQYEAPGSVQYEQEANRNHVEPEGVSNEAKPARQRIADEEDVHGFLSDDHEDIHSRIDRR